jgi:hypothetical protein
MILTLVIPFYKNLPHGVQKYTMRQVFLFSKNSTFAHCALAVPCLYCDYQPNLNRRQAMQIKTYQTDRRYRLAFSATFFTGMAVCTFGIANTTQYGWLHPSSVSGIVLGLAAMALGGGVLTRRKIGPVASDKLALTALLGIIVVKVILAALYPIFR